MTHPKPDPDDEPLHPKRQANQTATRPKASRPDVDLLLQACWAQGAWIEKAGNKHFKVYPADGSRMIPIPATPSDWRTIKNKRSQMRRAGIDPQVKK